MYKFPELLFTFLKFLPVPFFISPVDWVSFTAKTSMVTVHLLIEGDVQGVFYRATAKEIADKLGVTGWIKNSREGNVEAIVTGNETSVQKFINWCWQGPKNAQVTNVTVTKMGETAFNNFSVVR